MEIIFKPVQSERLLTKVDEQHVGFLLSNVIGNLLTYYDGIANGTIQEPVYANILGGAHLTGNILEQMHVKRELEELLSCHSDHFNIAIAAVDEFVVANGLDNYQLTDQMHINISDQLRFQLESLQNIYQQISIECSEGDWQSYSPEEKTLYKFWKDMSELFPGQKIISSDNPVVYPDESNPVWLITPSVHPEVIRSFGRAIKYYIEQKNKQNEKSDFDETDNFLIEMINVIACYHEQAINCENIQDKIGRVMSEWAFDYINKIDDSEKRKSVISDVVEKLMSIIGGFNDATCNIQNPLEVKRDIYGIDQMLKDPKFILGFSYADIFRTIPTILTTRLDLIGREVNPKFV